VESVVDNLLLEQILFRATFVPLLIIVAQLFHIHCPVIRKMENGRIEAAVPRDRLTIY
jgi:hypothetical protein